jgi:Alpha/beta hydrolase of unknown function (DUF900)
MTKTIFLFVLFSIAIIISLSSLFSMIQSLTHIEIGFLDNVFGQTTTNDSNSADPLISTRNNFNLTTGELKSDHSPIEYDAFYIPGLKNGTCPSENSPDLRKDIAIYIHGFLVNGDALGSENATEIFDRARQSINNSTNSTYLIGFNWDSDITAKDKIWEIAKDVAKSNGLKLAQFILDFKKKCPETDIRLITHSLGSRIVLSSLDFLNKNPEWNNKNFTIESVHLLGAAVDNEEVSKDPFDIVKDQTNGYIINLFELKSPVILNGTKLAYGQAIENEVVKFTNLFSSGDDSLEWFYPLNENDSALGQTGAEKGISLPINYKEKDVKDEIKSICDANGHNSCDFPYNTILGAIADVGDNHFGYIGFRDTNGTVKDDGAMDVVVSDWKNQTINKIRIE